MDRSDQPGPAAELPVPDKQSASQKRELRTALRAKLSGLPPDLRARQESSIYHRLTSLPEYQQAQTVAAYYGINWELDTRPLLQQILKDGKALALPRCEGKTMDFYLVTDLNHLKPDHRGIPEPLETARKLAPELLDLLILPGVAADLQGRRLGQGGGYYDRYLARQPLPLCVTLLLCRDICLLPQLPQEPFDCPVQLILTETRLLRLPPQ
ncbi:MAG: 5-formyltetrahydrofolate cyclo-ligase [Oscillospiraceae bacterium]|nr:5-formyltetrahydrofolate cyclo-ligase [Oscillospiraceae bacterium]MDD4368705.1 5-formyltetrahydrofolate cyclo-ligase [Oscillospiraceae bacterium]